MANTLWPTGYGRAITELVFSEKADMKHSRQALLKAKENLIGYLLQKAECEDWHGVADAAMDLREVDAKLDLLANTLTAEDMREGLAAFGDMLPKAHQ